MMVCIFYRPYCEWGLVVAVLIMQHPEQMHNMVVFL